jgi:UDP-N-acetylmuramate: L-alanyl-gamma-D-glutamyl-meso-diaminopimelate ligase
VLAVAGTHGKTTTSAMLAWILEDAGYAPGFLIGGVPMNFGVSARMQGDKDSIFFVIEADEYDTAFFDKRSKFVHYHAKTAILNNLEYDHADIFPDLGAIETQFHHLVRTVPASAASSSMAMKTRCSACSSAAAGARRKALASEGTDWAMNEHDDGSSM